jgi:hypothetical protein
MLEHLMKFVCVKKIAEKLFLCLEWLSSDSNLESVALGNLGKDIENPFINKCGENLNLAPLNYSQISLHFFLNCKKCQTVTI